MAATAAVRHCPDCDVRVNARDQRCWMCSRVLPAMPPVPARKDIQSATPASAAARQAPAGQAAAAPNPFAEETAAAPRYYYTTNTWGALGHLLAILAIIPATGVAFATTCTVYLVADPAILRGENTPGIWLTSCGSAVVVFGIFCMLIVTLRKKMVRRVEF